MEKIKLDKYIAQFEKWSFSALEMGYTFDDKADQFIKAASFVLSDIAFVTERKECFENIVNELFPPLKKAAGSFFEKDQLKKWVKKNILAERKTLIKRLQGTSGYQQLISLIAISREVIGDKALAILLKYFYIEFEKEALRVIFSFENKTFLPIYKTKDHTIFPCTAKVVLAKKTISTSLYTDRKFDYIEDDPNKSLSLKDILSIVNNILFDFYEHLKPSMNSFDSYLKDLENIFIVSDYLLLYKWENNIRMPKSLAEISKNYPTSQKADNLLLNQIFEEIYEVKARNGMPTPPNETKYLTVDNHSVNELDLLKVFKRTVRPLLGEVKISYSE